MLSQSSSLSFIEEYSPSIKKRSYYSRPTFNLNLSYQNEPDHNETAVYSMVTGLIRKKEFDAKKKHIALMTKLKLLEGQ